MRDSVTHAELEWETISLKSEEFKTFVKFGNFWKVGKTEQTRLLNFSNFQKY